MTDGERASHQDAFLAWIVWLADGGGITSMGLTLTVGGATVSGLLVSRTEYFARMGEKWAAGGDTGFHRQMGRLIASMGARDPEEARRAYQEMTGQALPPDASVGMGEEAPGESSTLFIHLAEARLVSASSLEPEDGLLFRARLSEVTGFMFGQLTR